MSLTKEEIEKATKEKEIWVDKATYWHTAIPCFDGTTRGSLTKDVQTIFNFEQLELNKSLSTGIRWNNRVNITIGIINLILFAINIILLVTKTTEI